MHLLQRVLNDNQDSRPTLQRLIWLQRKYQDAVAQHRKQGQDVIKLRRLQTIWGPWHWQGYYLLTRLADQAHSQFLRDLASKFKAEDFRGLDWLGMAARWADLISRK